MEIPYENIGLTHDANIRITSDIEDNSDIPERLINDQFKRLTVQFNIDDAYLFDVRIKDNLSITAADLQVYNNVGDKVPVEESRIYSIK